MPRAASTKERGYGAEHRKERSRWLARIQRGGVACWRCGKPIEPGSRWDLGHDDHDRSSYRGPECVRCNRVAGARKGARARNRQRRITAIRM